MPTLEVRPAAIKLPDGIEVPDINPEMRDRMGPDKVNAIPLGPVEIEASGYNGPEDAARKWWKQYGVQEPKSFLKLTVHNPLTGQVLIVSLHQQIKISSIEMVEPDRVMVARNMLENEQFQQLIYADTNGVIQTVPDLWGMSWNNYTLDLFDLIKICRGHVYSEKSEYHGRLVYAIDWTNAIEEYLSSKYPDEVNEGETE